MRNSKTLMTGAVAAAIVAGSASASTYLTLTQAAGYPSTSTAFLTGTEAAFTSDFNYQSNNNKLRLWNRSGGSSAPQAVVNPSGTYWGTNSGVNTGGPIRSWEVSWNNTTKVFSTNVYDSSDWTGLASASLSLATVNTTFGGAVDAGGDFILRGVAQFASGTAFTGANFYFRVNARVTSGSDVLSGININTRPDGATAGVGEIVLSNIQFDGGNGFTAVMGADGTFTGSQLNNYFNLAVVPAPGALALLGVAGLAGSRRRR